PRIRLHDLRHTWATLALQASVDVKIVSERLGHASAKITWDIYQHVTPTMQSDAAETVARLIFTPDDDAPYRRVPPAAAGGHEIRDQTVTTAPKKRGAKHTKSAPTSTFARPDAWARGDLNPHEVAPTGT